MTVVDWVWNNNSQKPTCCCQIFTGCWHESTPWSYQTNLHELQLASPSFCITGTWTSVGVTFLLLHRHMNFSWHHLPFVSQAHELQLASPAFCFTGTWTSVGVTFVSHTWTSVGVTFLLLHRHFASITLSPEHFTSCTHTHRVHTIHSLHTHTQSSRTHSSHTHCTSTETAEIKYHTHIHWHRYKRFSQQQQSFWKETGFHRRFETGRSK